MKPFSLRKRILVPLSLAIVFLLGAFVVGLHWFGQRSISERVTRKLEFVNDLFEGQLESDAHMMAASLHMLLRDEQLKAALKAKDRRALLEGTLALFGELKAVHGITHFYFTGPDRVNILRVHKPDKYGDKIDRFTTLEAERTGEHEYGIELGPLGTFTLRAVTPWHDGEQLIGYVELGEEIEHITPKLRHILGVEIYVVIEKKYLDRADWESGMRMLDRDANWNRFPSVVIIDHTQEELPEGLTGFLAEEQHTSMKTDLDVSFNDRRYRTRFIHLNDASGRGVGDMVVMTDVTDMVAHLHTAVFNVSAISLAIGGVLFVFFYLFVGRVERQMTTAQEGLRESEDRFRTLFNSATDAVFIHDFEGQMQEVNRIACDRLGYSRDELLRMKPKDFNAPEEASRIPKRFKELENKGYIRFETTHVNRNGKLIPVEIISRTISYQGKGMAISAARDITERKKAEEALRKVSEEQALLLDNIDTQIWYLTDVENHGAVNRALADFLGVQKDDLGNKNIYEILSKEEADFCVAGNREVFESKRQIRTEEWVKNAKGELRLLSVSKTPKLDEDGNVEYVVCSAEDITEFKRAEEALRESEEKLRTILESVHDVIFQLSPSGQIQYVTPNVTELYGYEVEELVGEPLTKTTPAREVLKALQAVKTSLSGETIKNFEINQVNGGGKVTPMEVSLTPVKKGDKVIAVQGVMRDITERKRAAEELKEHRDHLKELVAERTAELTKTNEQLQREITERRRAEQRLLTYHKRLRSLASALSLAEERERRRIATEVHDLLGQNLAFAKLKLATLLETSSAAARGAVDELNRLIDEAIQDTRFLVSELGSPVLYELGFVPAVEWLTQQTQKRHGIAIEFEADVQPKPLSDDVGILLFQAARELLANIVRHARADTAKVSITRTGDQIQVDVSDDGVGFDPAEMGPGMDQTGRFGLFSIRERLEPLGGHMEVASKPGHGTRVTLVAPLESE